MGTARLGGGGRKEECKRTERGRKRGGKRLKGEGEVGCNERDREKQTVVAVENEREAVSDRNEGIKRGERREEKRQRCRKTEGGGGRSR